MWQAIKARLVDEILINLVPVLLGEGKRVFDHLGTERIELERARVKLLSWLSLGAMSVEGSVAIVAGILAGSVALVGFGLDSAVEGFAGVIVWRFTGAWVMSQTAEHRAQRLVPIQFFLLAPYVASESVRALIGGAHPDASALGMGWRSGAW